MISCLLFCSSLLKEVYFKKKEFAHWEQILSFESGPLFGREGTQAGPELSHLKVYQFSFIFTSMIAYN